MKYVLCIKGLWHWQWVSCFFCRIYRWSFKTMVNFIVCIIFLGKLTVYWVYFISTSPEVSILVCFHTKQNIVCWHFADKYRDIQRRRFCVSTINVPFTIFFLPFGFKINSYIIKVNKMTCFQWNAWKYRVDKPIYFLNFILLYLKYRYHLVATNHFICEHMIKSMLLN